MYSHPIPFHPYPSTSLHLPFPPSFLKKPPPPPPQPHHDSPHEAGQRLTLYLFLKTKGVTKTHGHKQKRLEDRPKKRDCPELRMPGEGECVATELFYMRVGTLRLRRRWIDPDAVLRGQVFLTALSAVALLACGFVLGWVAATTAASGRYGGRGRGDAAMDILPEVSFGRGSGTGAGAGGGRLGFGESTEYHDRLVSASSSSSSLSGPLEWEEDGPLTFGGAAGAGCNCDCERVRVDGLLGFDDGIDLALGSLLGNVSSLYKY